MFTISEYETKNLKEETKKTITTYRNKIFILEHLKFKKTKKGVDFKDLKKAFDLEETAKDIQPMKIYLWESNDYYTLTANNGFARVEILINRRFNVERGDNVEEIAKTHRIYNGGCLKDYYYLETLEQLQEEINKDIENYKKWLAKAQDKLKNIDVLEKEIKRFYDRLNNKNLNDLFYKQEIRDLL